MPGPSNTKKKRKSQVKHKHRPNKPRTSSDSGTQSLSSLDSSSLSSPSPKHPVTPPPQICITRTTKAIIPKDDVPIDGSEEPIPVMPFIHDPGNGPRVRDTRAFLTSSYFAQPPALDDPLCAEFAQEAVLQMLQTVLPEELALILWYNKSRATGRICPACQRLYRLGDVLPDLIDDEHATLDKKASPQLEFEQEISGLCSPVCFVLASFNYPGAIKSAWGRMAHEMDEHSWQLLNSSGEGYSQGDLGLGLGMLVRMTRLPDLGLGQLCLPDVDFEPGSRKDSH